MNYVTVTARAFVSAVAGRPAFMVGLVSLAVALRLAVMPWSFHPWEAHTWLNIGSDLYQGNNPYQIGQALTLQVSSREPGTFGYSLFYQYIAYPPLWPYILYPFYLIVAPERVAFVFGGQLPDVLSPLASFALKLPIVVFDVAAAFLMFRLSKSLNLAKPWRSALLWLFNPLSFTMSAIWGNFESIVVFFFLASLLAFIDRRNNLSAIALGLAISTKMYPLLLAPVLTYGVLQRNGIGPAVRYIAITGVVVALICAPFALANLEAFLSFLAFHSERLGGGMTYYNFNWLAWVAWGKSPLEWGLVFTNLYFPIMLWALTLTYLWVLRLNVFEPRRMVEACAVVLLVFFATTKLVNEPYAVWVLPLMLLISQYNPRLKWPLVLIIGIPLVFLAINVPWPNLFRPFLTDTSIGESLVSAFTLSPVKRYISLFALGTGFSITCLITAFLIFRMSASRSAVDPPMSSGLSITTGRPERAVLP